MTKTENVNKNIPSFTGLKAGDEDHVFQTQTVGERLSFVENVVAKMAPGID